MQQTVHPLLGNAIAQHFNPLAGRRGIFGDKDVFSPTQSHLSNKLNLTDYNVQKLLYMYMSQKNLICDSITVNLIETKKLF